MVIASKELRVTKLKDEQKFKNLISMATKAGKVQLGFGAAKVAISGHKVKLLLLSEGLSWSTKKAMIRKARLSKALYKEVPISLENLLMLLGKRVGIVAVTDSGFAKKIIEQIEEPSDVGGGIIC